MGDGKNLKKYLDEKGTNVRKIAKATGISATTLYSIIQKDSNIRFDFALRLANELQIDVNEICSASPFSGTIKEEEIYCRMPHKCLRFPAVLDDFSSYKYLHGCITRTYYSGKLFHGEL